MVLADRRCIGSYVFLWTSNRQERTHTWFNMFCNGAETEAVENHAVHVDRKVARQPGPKNNNPSTINGMEAVENVSVAPGSISRGEVIADDPDPGCIKD